MKVILYILFYIGVAFVFPKFLLAQVGFEQIVERPRDFRVMFYNCENYFDTINDPLINDDEFTPEGTRFWDGYKYYRKSINLSKAIIATGGWKPVDLIGLCEVENRSVLDKLCKHTPLYKNSYNIAHFESPDSRGIDVALLYRDESFEFISKSRINITKRCDFTRPTRDILYVKGVVNAKDTLHVFVNHWPSRWGGQLESEERREFAASVLRVKVDSLFQNNSYSNIVIMGDFNDEPHNSSVKKILKAKELEDVFQKDELYNMMYSIADHEMGTHKYQGKWGVLDHIILSGNLLDPNGLYTKVKSTTIYNANYLLIEDATHLGEKPFRTYVGFSYKGGFSDHFPVFIDFYLKE